MSIMNKEELPPVRGILSRPATYRRHRSFRLLQLPNEAREMMECTSVDDRRHAIYLPDSLPPAPPPKDESVAGSRPESLAATLVDGMEVRGDTTVSTASMRMWITYRSVPTVLIHARTCPPRHCLQSAVPPPLEAQRERVERALPQPSPEVRQKASQKSLPKVRNARIWLFISRADRVHLRLQIFRPPTPPIPAQRPKLRSGGHSATSSQDGHTHIVRRWCCGRPVGS